MIRFNENLLNYKSKNFATISIDNIGTIIRDDAYSVDMYDDDHFFLGVYIANPFVEGDNYRLMNYIFKRNEYINYWKNNLKNVRISKVSHNYNNLKKGRK